MAEDKKLSILQLLPALDSGGVERGTLEVAHALVERGHRALVMSAGGRQVPALLESGAEHFAWPVGKKSLGALLLVGKLRKFLLEQSVDIIHARSRVPAWIAWLAWRGMNPATRPRFVTTVHGLYSVNRYSRIMTLGERVIAVSNTVRDYILREYPDTLPWHVQVIHRGVEARAYPHGWKPEGIWQQAFFSQFPNASGKLLITLPGRITRLKGHEDFIEYTGLRPGEKLYEELLADDESTLPTPHPKLRVAKARAADVGWHVECLGWLDHPGTYDEVTVKRQLKIWVPEYQPESAPV